MRKATGSTALVVILTLTVIASTFGGVALLSVANSVSGCTTRCWNAPSEQHRSENSYVADAHYQGNPQSPP
jgi:hypothetical protein